MSSETWMLKSRASALYRGEGSKRARKWTLLRYLGTFDAAA